MTNNTGRRFSRISIFSLAWPLVFITFLTLLATLGNVVLLSAVSAELNAAVATSNQILGLLYDLCVLFSIGGLVIVAQQLGGGKTADAQKSALVLLRASVFLGLAIAVFVALAGPWLLTVINTPDEVRPDARLYLWIVSLAMAFNAYIVAATAVLRAFGQTGKLLVLAVVVNLADVSLLAFLLLVANAGVVGAALPTLVVRGIGVAILHTMVKKTAGVSVFVGPSGASNSPSDANLHKAMVGLSLPTVLENSVFNMCVLVTVLLVNVFGTDAINARSYVFTVTALVTAVSLALTQASETVVGWDIGEGQWAHARKLAVQVAVVSATAAGALGLVLWACSGPILQVFSPNEEVMRLAKAGLLISVVMLPLQAASSTFYGALRSAGDVLWPMGVSIFASVAVLLPAAWLLVEVVGWGVIGSFWAVVAAEVVKTLLLASRWLSTAWARTNRVSKLVGSSV